MNHAGKLRRATENAARGETAPEGLDELLNREDFCFQLLGLDGDGRAVYYSSDSGRAIRYRYLDGELVDDSTTFIGPNLETDVSRSTPFTAAFVFLTERGADWNWIHPRFRWLATQLTKLEH